MPSRNDLARHAGRLGLTLAAIAVGTVACFVFPAQLTTPPLRAALPVGAVRALLRVVLVLAVVLGATGVAARPVLRSTSTAAIALVAIALACGGADVAVRGPVAPSLHVALDWLLLDLVLMALVFAPLERRGAGARDPADTRVDLAHFAVGHLLLPLVSFLAVAPAQHLLSFAVVPGVQRAVAAQPWFVAAVEVLVVADVTEYAWHRLSHRTPLLWRIHAVHHSTPQMGWLAASRMHLADVVMTRAVVFTPIFLLGFARPAVLVYLVVVSFHAVFIHVNVRWRLGALEHLVVTPRYHHFHHASDPEAIDTNFALHLPALDRLFGTHRLPPALPPPHPSRDAWPRAYGIVGAAVPRSYLGQLLYPLTRRRRARP